MSTRGLARRAQRAWPCSRWVALVALCGAGALLSDVSLAAPPRAKATHDSALPNITYTGFRLLKDGRSLVYVQLSAKVPVSVQKQKNRVVYQLEGAQVTLKNNKNPLITREFATILESARLVVDKPGRSAKAKGSRQREDGVSRVQLVLQLREDVTPTHTMSDRPSGALLEITLPAMAAARASR